MTFDIGTVLEKTYGLEKYIGICGGGTQNLYILSKLCKHNNLKEIVLIDENGLQLDNFKQIITLYNNFSQSQYEHELIKLIKKRAERIRFNIIRYLRFDKEKYKRTNLAKPPFNKNIKITLVTGDIFDFLSKASYNGKYFFYLSNILNYRERTTNVGGRSAKLIEVLKNKNVASNSLLLLIRSTLLLESTKTIIIKKSDYLKKASNTFFARLFNLLSMLKP